MVAIVIRETWSRWTDWRKIRALDKAPIGSIRTESETVRNRHLYEPLGWECIERQPVHLQGSGWLDALTYIKRRPTDPAAVADLQRRSL